jgi:CRISPR-associated exonuclease Cas4
VPFLAAVILGGVFLLALFVSVRARRRIRLSGLPDGRIVSQDADRRRDLEGPLVSSCYALIGNPDYLVETASGPIPVELKSRDCARSGPYASDAAQLTVYCVLVEDSLGVTPSHGIVQYADRSWPIRYTTKSRKRILLIVGEMREARRFQTVHRDHEQAGRCRACGYRAACDEALD